MCLLLNLTSALLPMSLLLPARAGIAAEHGSIDGSMPVAGGTSTLPFGGAVPPNGFMVQAPNCTINDNGPANWIPNAQAGFGVGPDFLGTTFITPRGYQPIGPVRIYCPQGGYVAARAW
jgi:hypothetical protein